LPREFLSEAEMAGQAGVGRQTGPVRHPQQQAGSCRGGGRLSTGAGGRGNQWRRRFVREPAAASAAADNKAAAGADNKAGADSKAAAGADKAAAGADNKAGADKKAGADNKAAAGADKAAAGADNKAAAGADSEAAAGGERRSPDAVAMLA
jgi:hypothetical protein